MHRGARAICESIQKCLLLDLSTLMVLRKMWPEIIPLNIREAVIAHLTLKLQTCTTVCVAVDEPQCGKALRPLAVREQDES